MFMETSGFPRLGWPLPPSASAAWRSMVLRRRVVGRLTATVPNRRHSWVETDLLGVSGRFGFRPITRDDLPF